MSKTYTCFDAPVEIDGIEIIDPENHILWRLPDDETALVSDSVRERSKTAGGGRVRFRTNSKHLKLGLQLHTLGVDPCMAVCASSGADVFRGTGLHSYYMGQINPWTYDNKTPEKDFVLDGQMHQIVINLPRNERTAGITITIDDDAILLAPESYSRPGRICFYGSSITEGGCCSRPGNAYTAIVSRWLDIDYVNYGFSGAARGEDAMASIIAKRDFSALIYDYDHNAPDADHLRKTHERFFLTVRAAHPDIPIVIMTKPDFDSDPIACAERRSIIRATFDHAVARGDNNVFFLDGETFFGTFGRELCTVDGCHPNDLGFYRMAEAVYGVLVRAL